MSVKPYCPTYASLTASFYLLCVKYGIVVKYDLYELLKGAELYELFKAIKEFLPNF